MNKNQDKEEIKKIIAKYEQVKNSAKINNYTEEETKNAFIKPLFEALGWDFSEKEEVSAEEHVSLSGRLDYGFHINGRPKFYLEVKKLKADLNNEEFARQAIKYSFNKGVTWAVLTDFEGIKVFNAQSPSKYLGDKLYFELKYSEYLDHFDKLWELSKESFKEDLIDQKAIEAGKKLQKIPITELLSKDLNECRKLLTDRLREWNKKVPQSLLDEGVQKLLDRLIFIKVAEDRKIENNVLLPLINQWRLLTGSNKPTLYQSMAKKFRELDDVYNSNLFEEHAFERWEESGEVLEEVLNILNGKKGYYEFDFSVMSADTLGSVYENYLGYKLSQSQKGLTLHKDAGKRKEQGIYYTPPFIVDYIVRNALKPVLDKCTSVNELKKIKVLDPACGSGSFLTKALEVILEKYKDFNYKDDENLRIQIILENLYGVDLDEQAVEIARLSLLINALKERGKLPSLENNIKNGNSLISGTDKELEKYFGKNFKDKKTFDWEEKFPEVFKQGGFDVIIGNPPWGANIDEDVKYFEYTYPNSTKAYKDIYKIFIDRAILLLKTSGNLGFIIPNTFLYQPRYEDIKQIINNYENYVVNLGERIFNSVDLPSCILILSKHNGTNKFITDLTKEDRNSLSSRMKELNINREIANDKIEKKLMKDTGLTFDDVFVLKDAGVKHQRVNIGKSKKGDNDLRERIYYSGKIINPTDHPLLIGSDINRYIVIRNPQFFLKSNYKNLLNKNEIVYFDEKMMRADKKIVWRQTADGIKATVVENVWFANTIQAAIVRDSYKGKVEPFYALSIFNSSYIDLLYKQKVLETGKVFPQVKLGYLRSLPFIVCNKVQQGKLSSLAKKTIQLNMELNNTTKNSNKWNDIKSETEKTDKKIDGEVYKLYNLTPEEIKIVENP